MVRARLKVLMRELAVLLSISLEVTIYLSHTHPITTTIMKEEMVKLTLMEVLLIGLQHHKPSNLSTVLHKMLPINRSLSRLMGERRAAQPIIMRLKLS